MNTTRRPWTAEQHRRYLETWLTGLASILMASSKPLAAIAFIAAIFTKQHERLIQWALDLF